MIRTIKSLPVKKVALGVAVVVVLVLSLLDIFAPQSLNIGMGIDESAYETVRIGKLGCRIHTEKGEILPLEPMKGTNELLIPKQSVISGDCFIVEQ